MASEVMAEAPCEPCMDEMDGFAEEAEEELAFDMDDEYEEKGADHPHGWILGGRMTFEW